MKAIVFHKYGSIDSLELIEVTEAFRYFGKGLALGKVVITM